MTQTGGFGLRKKKDLVKGSVQKILQPDLAPVTAFFALGLTNYHFHFTVHFYTAQFCTVIFIPFAFTYTLALLLAASLALEVFRPVSRTADL